MTQDEAKRILHEFHYRFSREHYNGPTTMEKILQAGYYCPTIFQDSLKITQECRKCRKKDTSYNAS